jgi:hypothetical protein
LLGGTSQTIHTSPQPRAEPRCPGDSFSIVMAVPETETDMRPSLQIQCRCGWILVSGLEHRSAAIPRASPRTPATPSTRRTSHRWCRVGVLWTKFVDILVHESGVRCRRATLGRNPAVWGTIPRVRNDRTLTSHMLFPLPLLLPVDGRSESRPTVMTYCAIIPKCPQYCPQNTDATTSMAGTAGGWGCRGAGGGSRYRS